jgi:thioredoxin 1
MNTKDKCDRVEHQQDLGEILAAKSRVIALWYASWCPFCTKFLPIFEKHAEGEGQNFLLVRDDQESMGEKYAVEVFPTVLFVENGVVSKRLDGARPGSGTHRKTVGGLHCRMPLTGASR